MTNLEQDVADLDNRMDEIGAMAAAFSGLHPNPRATGRNQVAIGAGIYKEATAAALGYFHIINENVMLNAGVSSSFHDGNTAAKAGITFCW
ncbi:YadA C-terminal domain-containing protein [Breoghania sp.]|uniref:YadA C-terminal domain-containing protein n=1 Tax=Breoghania sp. TaxID=2065378 RepID=UPI0029CA51EB|nr:YadA C-terminal domain-containing protein [Breoghania sp.]